MIEYTWRLHVPIIVEPDGSEAEPDGSEVEAEEVAVLVSELTLPFPYQDEGPWIEVPATAADFTLTVQPLHGIWRHTHDRFDVYCDPERFENPDQVSSFMAAAMQSGRWAVDESREDPAFSGAHLSVG